MSGCAVGDARLLAFEGALEFLLLFLRGLGSLKANLGDSGICIGTMLPERWVLDNDVHLAVSEHPFYLNGGTFLAAELNRFGIHHR